MMKERLTLLMQDAREEFARLPNKDEYSRLSTVVYFSPNRDNLPVHLLVDIAALKEVDLEDFCEETDFFSFYEGEILGEVSDCYTEIKSFLLEFAQLYQKQMTIFMSEPLIALLHHTKRHFLTMNDILRVLDFSCQTGDFSLWNPDRPEVDLEVGFRVDEELS